MKDEYIRKQDAIDAIHCDIKITGRENAETVCKTIKSFTDGIKSLEPADVVPVRHARWVNGCCDRCGEHALYWSMASTYHESDFCPYCGAKMDG